MILNFCGTLRVWEQKIQRQLLLLLQQKIISLYYQLRKAEKLINMIPIFIHLQQPEKAKIPSFIYHLYYLISPIFTTPKRFFIQLMQHKKNQARRPYKHHQTNNRPSAKQNNPEVVIGSNERVESQSQDLFELEYHTMKKLRLPIHRKISKGAWTLQENKVYLDFLIKNKECFCSESVRRQSRVFCRLSEILHKKRTPDQCRGHHQKLIGKQEQSVDILINKLTLKIAQTEKQKRLKIKTRIIGKYQKAKQQPKLKEQEMKEDRSQILRVDLGSFCKITTFKNSSHILLQIEEDAIQSYSFM